MRNTFLFILSISFLYACKSKDETTPNRPPNVFTVTPTLKPDGKTIVLNWSKAKDPDGDAVTYVVVLKDTLIKNLSDTTFILSNLDFNYSQTGKVIAKDTKGLTTETSFTATTKTKTFVNIPDAIFEKYLVDMKIDKDGVVNGKMDTDDAKGITVIDLENRVVDIKYLFITPIKSLTGIEAFTDLQYLYCNNHQLTSLDISKNIALQYLICPNNQLTSLDVGKNIALKGLGCTANSLKILDVSKNITLQSLSCNSNKLTSLDISNNIALQYLDCSNNTLTSLDISKNIDLQYLNCINNQIKTICVSDKAKTNWQKDITAVYAVCP